MSENTQETNATAVQVLKAYATTNNEITLIVKPAEGAQIPGVAFPDGTIRVVWDLETVKKKIADCILEAIAVEDMTDELLSLPAFLSNIEALAGLGELLLPSNAERPEIDPSLGFASDANS